MDTLLSSEVSCQQGEVHAKLRGAYVDPAAGRMRFGPWAERWYNSTAHLKPTTRRDYRKLLDQQVLPRFRDVPFASIDTLAVEEWLSGVLAGDPKADPPREAIGAKRAGKALQVLSQALGAAVKGKRLAVNPAAGVSKPKGQPREMHFLDLAQVERLAEAIRGPYGVLIRSAAYTGLRPCELTALRVGRLDLLAGTARICEAAPEVDGKLHWGGVKTHEARTVRLPRFLAEELGAHLANRPNDPEALVFPAPLSGARCGSPSGPTTTSSGRSRPPIRRSWRRRSRASGPRCCLPASACTTCATRAPRC